MKLAGPGVSQTAAKNALVAFALQLLKVKQG